MMLIEADKRDKEKLKLPYSGDEFYVPENLYIIGMLNTADRSLALIDYALRRRFSFYKVVPAFNNEKFRQYIEEYLDKSTRFQFIMPNTPAMVGEGVLLFEEKNSLLPEEREEIKKLFEALGIVIELPVHLMGIGGALTGCGPAFVDLIIEALGDAGVKYGVPRKQAYEMVSQMILGSAKLQLETGEHPGVLKDNVCSPAGTTICGVDALEHAGIRAGFIDAIDAIMNK